jgi:predicted RNA-binding Zn-ribbon protein involved in translation (DUF1610 family)
MSISNTYYKQHYTCSQCGTTQKHYVWSSEIETATHTCISCKSEIAVENLSDEGIKEASCQILNKLTKQEVVKDRKKRSKEHFVREVLPTINKKDRQYFIKKHGWKS